MMYPERFIQTSDFGTLKNDSGSTTFSVTVNSGFVFNPSSPIIGTHDVEIGTRNAPIRARGTTSKRGGSWIVGTFLLDSVNMQPSGFPVAPYTIYCALFRVSPSIMRLQVYVEGHTGPNITVRETFTVTFIATTFLSPLE